MSDDDKQMVSSEEHQHHDNDNNEAIEMIHQLERLIKTINPLIKKKNMITIKN